MYGSVGFRQTSVKSICAEAGLTERYFYESFNNSEELLLAAYHAVTTGLLNELTQAVEHIDGNRPERARIMLNAYFSLLKREPAAARIILIEIRGVSRTATQAYTDALHEFSRRLADDFSIGSGDAQQLLALGVVGGISLIALHWIEQGHAQSVEVMVDVALQLTTALL
jgi:AcrR family transcriptional regulator